MGNIKSKIGYTLIFLVFLISSCKDELKDVLIPYPEDINFNEIELDRFSFKVSNSAILSGSPSAGYVSANAKIVTGNSFKGFALSNKNYRSYPWVLSPDFTPSGGVNQALHNFAIDSTIFSVYTTAPNRTGTCLVGNAVDDEAFLTFPSPAIVEHVLIANTTYSYLLATYGSKYSGTLNPVSQEYSLTGTKVRNPNISSPYTSDYGRWYLPTKENKDLIRLAGVGILENKPIYYKLVVTGFKSDVQTGSVDFYLGTTAGGDIKNPTLNIIRSNWTRVDLAELGVVDKLLFTIDGNYVDGSGQLLTPRYFALDGIRLRK